MSSSSTEEDKESVVPIDLVATIGKSRPVTAVSDPESWAYPGTTGGDKERHNYDELLMLV